MTSSGSRSTSRPSSRSRSPKPRTKRDAERAGLSARRRDALRRRLLGWYRASHRDLPWRRTRDPYRIWLSETMLQQTRVETVIPYYERFLERFPDVAALAAADEEDVLAAWAGLGYYARARNLKRAAEQVVRDHGGRVPRDAGALAALPGVGRYTAGALRSIAFREPAPLVDGNVRRVLARLLGDPAPSDTVLWRAAEDLVPAERPDLFNQALMELGATLCAPREPACSACPVTNLCQARATGRPAAYPAPRTRPAPREVRAVAGVLERRRPRAILLVRRPSRGLLGGLWELPSVEGDDASALPRAVEARTGLATRALEPLAEVRHGFTHRALTLELVRLARSGGRLRPAADARWCTPADLAALPLSTLTRKTLRAAGIPVDPPRGG